MLIDDDVAAVGTANLDNRSFRLNFEIAVVGVGRPFASQVEAIHSARERVWITSPYFVPDESVLSALQLAALEGVDVRVLLPERPDHTKRPRQGEILPVSVASPGACIYITLRLRRIKLSKIPKLIHIAADFSAAGAGGLMARLGLGGDPPPTGPAEHP